MGGRVLNLSLTWLAQNADATGNYYSSRGDHTKALKSFKKAVLLNREYLPAWTLLGHEWVELKNSNAAIEAYRKAIGGSSVILNSRIRRGAVKSRADLVDINAKDYRAWYGLGQTYELLDMPHYAIDYYQQATALRFVDTSAISLRQYIVHLSTYN